jgi:hypothetical protein
MKVACQVREGAVGKGLSKGSTSLAAYFNPERRLMTGLRGRVAVT